MKKRRSPARIVGRALMVILISGFAGASLVRFSPGFGVDERALDPRLSAETRHAIESEYNSEQNHLAFYARFIVGVVSGDAGRSIVFGQPVKRLIGERIPVTLHSIAVGLGLGWTGALLCAVAATLSRRPSATLAVTAFSGTLLSIPAALLATMCLLLRIAPGFAIAAVVFPRVFPHAFEQLRASLVLPHVMMARATGLSTGRLLLYHVFPPALIPLVALAGVSVPLAFGAAIPVEALAGSPGIGQLAWRAALGRDLPVLVAVTLMLTVVTVLANLAADLVLARFGRPENVSGA
jgi:peptide/nickel transport system permease protein